MNINIVINGVARSGKNTFVSFVDDFIKYKMSSFVEVYDISSVDKVKIAACILGWDQEKDDKGRKFLSDLKNMSTELYDGPMRYMKEYADMDGIKFFHIREPEEIARFVEEHPETITLCINRPGVETPNNMADRGVDQYTYNFYINNDEDLKELRIRAYQFIQYLILIKSVSIY